MTESLEGIEANARLNNALRRGPAGAYQTGIDGNTMERSDLNFYAILDVYMTARADMYGGDAKPDYRLRREPNPIQYALDALQRRTR